MERSSELVNLSEWNMDNFESIFSEEVTESGFFGLDDNLGW